VLLRAKLSLRGGRVNREMPKWKLFPRIVSNHMVGGLTVLMAGSQNRESQKKERDQQGLVLEAQRGDVDAFRALYELHRDRVYNLAHYMLGDALWAEDTLQTVFMKAHRGLDTFRLESAFGTWIYRITLNECQNQLRGHKAQLVPLEEILGEEPERDDRPLPDAAHQASQRSEVVRQAVMDLSQKLRAVVVLKYFEGLSYEEIANLLECSPGTVASRMNRALLKIEERLRPLKGVL